MINRENITSSSVTEALDEEAKKQKGMSKTARQARRNALSNPSAISARLSSVLAERFPPSVIADHLMTLLTAVTVTKDGREIPDVRSREAGLKLILSYSIGKPIERSEVRTINATPSSEDIKAQIKGSAALRAELADLLEAS